MLSPRRSSNGHCPLSFGLSDEDWMSLLHLELGRRWPWLDLGWLAVTKICCIA